MKVARATATANSQNPLGRGLGQAHGRFAATAVSGITASLIEGLALIAAAKHSELLLPLRDYWSQANAAKDRSSSWHTRTARTGLPVGTSLRMISMEPVLNSQIEWE